MDQLITTQGVIMVPRKPRASAQLYMGHKKQENAVGCLIGARTERFISSSRHEKRFEYILGRACIRCSLLSFAPLPLSIALLCDSRICSDSS
jgi:hypothetical protein